MKPAEETDNRRDPHGSQTRCRQVVVTRASAQARKPKRPMAAPRTAYNGQRATDNTHGSRAPQFCGGQRPEFTFAAVHIQRWRHTRRQATRRQRALHAMSRRTPQQYRRTDEVLPAARAFFRRRSGFRLTQRPDLKSKVDNSIRIEATEERRNSSEASNGRR